MIFSKNHYHLFAFMWIPKIKTIAGCYNVGEETLGNHQAYRRGHLGRHGGLMVSALDSGASALGSSPGWGHCVVFLGKMLYSYGASLHPGI